MKKEDISGFIVYLIITGLAALFCLTILRENSAAAGQPLGFWAYWFFIIGAVLLGIILNAILYELAHVLGAKKGRYEILSVNVLFFCFAKDENNKYRFKFEKYDGLTGETKIFPLFHEGEKQSNPRPYLLFGTLFYGIEIILVVTAFVLLTNSTDFALINLGYFILIVGVTGGMIVLYNIIPLRLDSKTDGYQLTLISNPKNKVAFNELLRVEHEIDIGNKDVEIKTFDIITNFTAELNLNKVYALLDKREYAPAIELLDVILKEDKDVAYKIHLRALAQKIFIKLITLDSEEADKYYKENVDLHLSREISKDVSMPSIRTYILISGLIDKSRSETLITLNNVPKAYKKTKKNRRDIEASLYNEALDHILKAHPTWDELEGYRLNIEK